MITIFTIPKAFSGRSAVHQVNAVRSWLAASSDLEVILCGDDPGVADTAKQLGARHVGGLRATSLGTPLLSDAFRCANEAARGSSLVYVNADIILPRSFTQCVATIRASDYLGVCARRNVDLDTPLDFADARWEQNLLSLARATGTAGYAYQIDGFAFPRNSALIEMPDFAVGRPGWDNWIIWRARSLGLPVIDLSRRTVLIHQNHDYGHVKKSTGVRWEGPEADENRRLMGGPGRRYTIADATHIVTRFGEVPALDPYHLRIRATKFAMNHPILGRPTRLLRKMLGRPADE